jgi:hypothetical protein
MMDWIQVLVIVFGNAAWVLPLFLWSRSESRADNRQMLSMMQGIQSQIIAIQQEIKDFHGRLCAIEERYRNK